MAVFKLQGFVARAVATWVLSSCVSGCVVLCLCGLVAGRSQTFRANFRPEAGVPVASHSQCRWQCR